MSDIGPIWRRDTSVMALARGMYLEEPPPVDDGLSPIHRRLLHQMASAGWVRKGQYRKCLRLIESLASDGSNVPVRAGAYRALVDMVQDFTMRVPLVDGQGNFGSTDADDPAEARFTECRLTHAGEALTAGVRPGQLYSPGTPLQSSFPNLLVNGGYGPGGAFVPHNLSEAVVAVELFLDDPEVSVEKLLEVMPGPDFPAGGLVHDRAQLHGAYATGRGSLTLYAKVHFEPGPPVVRANPDMPEDNDAFPYWHPQLVVTEIPFGAVAGAGPDSITGSITSLARTAAFRDILYVQDESDRHGTRIVIMLRDETPAKPLLDELYECTPLRQKIAVRMTATVEGQTRALPLNDLIAEWVASRRRAIGATAAHPRPQAIDRQIRNELHALMERLGDSRRTTIAPTRTPTLPFQAGPPLTTD